MPGRLGMANSDIEKALFGSREVSRQVGVTALAFSLSVCFAASGATLYVDGSVCFSGDGRSWQGALKTIQEGIDGASDGDTVVVAVGSYTENVRLRGKNIALTSTAPLAPGIVSNTIIDGSGLCSVVAFSGAENDSCVLSGFTIRDGVSPYGGGICGGTPDSHSRAAIRNNVIIGNEARPMGCCPPTGGIGGGIAFCDGKIESNTVAENVAGIHGGGLADCRGMIQNNVIAGNSASFCGGGLLACPGIIRNNVIVGNAADEGGGLHYCGGTIGNNLVAANSARQGAGLAYCDGEMRNCVVWANTAAASDSIIYQSSCPAFSCIQGWSGGEGNISEDPLFLDADGPDDDPKTYHDNNYRLARDSPCVDSGINAPDVPPTDIAGNPRILYGGKNLTVDMGPYEYYINEIRLGTDGSTILTWSSLSGKTYAIYLSSDMMTWHLAAGDVPAVGDTVTSWRDDTSDAHSSSVRRRYYRIITSQ